jgi:hypothetical protein
MRVKRVEDLSPEPIRCVIVNVHTELVSTLAIASAVARASIPVLLIDCDPSPASRAYFSRLMLDMEFDVVEAPRFVHGRMLDHLFERIKADLVLLLDSDAEILDPRLISEMRESFSHPAVFGAGFTNGPGWLQEPEFGEGTALYQERAWMPCVLFRRTQICKALAARISFQPRVIYNDLMFSEAISRRLAKRFQTGLVPRSRVIHRLPKNARSYLRRSQLSWLCWARRYFYGLRPNYVYADTGADVYQWCKYREGGVFAGKPLALLRNQVAHYSGVTRLRLEAQSGSSTLSDRLAEIEDEVRHRLQDAYHLRLFETVG